jgi:hypothetical protein
VATAFFGKPHQLLRSALLACYAKGLTGTVAATDDPSPLNYHFPDRLKMLLLSNRKGDIFEELAIHIAFAPGFVKLHEFSKLHAKIRDSPYC